MNEEADVLLTFAGFHDPYSLGLIDEEEQTGPILTLFRERPFTHVVIFGTPGTAANAEETREALTAQHPDIEVDVRQLPLEDPTDYGAILSQLREQFSYIQEEFLDAQFFVSVASGTPQMHACWVVLLREEHFSATILHFRPPRFVTAERPLVMEVDLEECLSPDYDFEEDTPSCHSFEPPADPSLHDLYSPGPLPRPCASPSKTVQVPVANLTTARQSLGIVGEHQRMTEILERVEIAAPTDMSVLILGETGTGKELIARLVHNLSDRVNAPFIPLNCGAIPKELIESTLFGHIKGAFTGATRDHAGKFMEANGGTFFLDELGELLPETQVKLLRVIEDGVIQPIGAMSSRKVDVRVVAATNQDLRNGIRTGTFREDLYYRLSTVQLHVPALRERPSDIPAIAIHLLEDINARLRRPKRFSRDALAQLQRHAWPGNVRDLRNVLTQSALFCKNEVIDAVDLVMSDMVSPPDTLDYLPEPTEGFDLNGYLDSVRKQLFLRSLQLAGGNQSKAARLLGVSPQAVHKFMNDQRD